MGNSASKSNIVSEETPAMASGRLGTPPCARYITPWAGHVCMRRLHKEDPCKTNGPPNGSSQLDCLQHGSWVRHLRRYACWGGSSGEYKRDCHHFGFSFLTLLNTRVSTTCSEGAGADETLQHLTTHQSTGAGCCPSTVCPSSL